MNIRTYINKALKVFKSKIDDNFYNKTEIDEKMSSISTTDPNSHTHANKSIIDQINDTNGILTYKGKLIVNDTEYSYRTMPEFKNPNTRGTIQFIKDRGEE